MYPTTRGEKTKTRQANVSKGLMLATAETNVHEAHSYVVGTRWSFRLKGKTFTSVPHQWLALNVDLFDTALNTANDISCKPTFIPYDKFAEETNIRV
jgi:hypothetical protein